MADQALSKGANVSVLQRSDVEGSRVQAVVRWSDPLGTADIDVSALLLGRDGRVRSDDDFVFYNAPAGGDGSVRLLGERADDESGEDRVSVDLESLPSEVERVVIAASLDPGTGSGFRDVRELGLVLLDSTGRSTAHFDIDDAGTETAMVLGELYLRGEEWKFRAVGQGWDSGLAGLATDFGITVADEAQGPAADPTDDNTVPVTVDPTAPAADGEASTDLVELPPVSETMDRESTGIAATDTAQTQRPPRQGVRTRKKRTTAATLTPLTLAVDPSWQPARLFSISGVGNAEEQEKRATSSLLSTMMAVRDFGRALVSRFGGPAGTIETYLEVPFKIDERTSIPDGVLRVARAGRVWTALLEVKTGASLLRQEQVDRYLDLARQQGYDAVITLSNDLAPVGGVHPVIVDGRKLRKVALHHISWSEVLHEAQMQLTHRGLDDRLQAWLLAELIRYLEHPRSGAAGFDDMGMAWVPVREAVAAGTLRPADRKVGAVTTSWEKLVRHLALRLTGQLGVTVSPVLPRKFATDHVGRAQAAAAQLADDGTLAATLRIPGAAGPLAVTADLRTGQVRTSIEIESPRDGGSARRVNWILRQLTQAPDTLIVEVLFARREQTSCEQLKDIRATAAALLPDAAADVRAFRLTMSAPLGTRRNGLKKAFIPSVNDAVDAFYAGVVQGLRPSPPKLPTEVAEEAISAVQTSG